MSLQSLTTWQAEYTTLTSDLQNCTSSYSYCSGRKFQIPSTTEFCSLYTLEERVFDLFRRVKESWIESIKEYLADLGALSSKDKKTVTIEDFRKIVGELSNMTDVYNMLVGPQDFKDLMMRLDQDSDARFYSDASLLFRIVLCIYRFFANLFKPAHQEFGARLEKLQKEDETHYQQMGTLIKKQQGNFAIVINSYIQELQSRIKASVNTTEYGLTRQEVNRLLNSLEGITKDELRKYFPHLYVLQDGQVSKPGTLKDLETKISTLFTTVHELKEKLEALKIIFRQLLDTDDADCSIVYGVKFTAEEIKFLESKEDPFFLRLKAADKNEDTPLDWIFSVPPNYSRGDLKRSYDALMEKYDLKDSQGIHYPIRICVKLSIITQRLVHLLLDTLPKEQQ